MNLRQRLTLTSSGGASWRGGNARKLAEQEHALEGSRLQREDAYRESMTDAERRWLREHRTAHAAHWNMLSTINARELAGGF